jgi:hypothetical protein
MCGPSKRDFEPSSAAGSGGTDAGRGGRDGNAGEPNKGGTSSTGGAAGAGGSETGVSGEGGAAGEGGEGGAAGEGGTGPGGAGGDVNEGMAGMAGAGGLGSELPTAGLVLRLRADVGISKEASSVTSWADQSGSGRDVSQPVAAARPTFLGNWKGGKPAVHFDATDDVLQNTNSQILGSGDDMTLFVVGARNTDPDTTELNDKWFGLAATGKRHRFQTTTVSGSHYVFTDDSSTNVSPTMAFGFATNPVYLMWASDGTGGATTMLVRVNGAMLPTSNDMPSFPDTVSGFEVGGANNNFGGKKIGELIAYNRVLSGPEIAQVEAYIVDFWGAF